MTIAYTVQVEFTDAAVCQEYEQWLTHGHLQQVVDGGAEHATLLRIDALHLEVRYRFASAQTFAAYETGAAVALRADSAARFPTSRGVSARRSVGTIIASVPAKP